MAEPGVSPPQDIPPKPVLTFRVGVTGHRPKREHLLSTDAQTKVEEVLQCVFGSIDSALARAHDENGQFYRSDHHHQVRLVSGMAEGIDQVAAHLRPSTWALEAILPFPIESYKKDFEQSAADKSRSVVPEFEATLKQAQRILELPDIDDPSERDGGYARLGNFLVRQVDLLVAVWNGERAGGPGGTADVIRHAIRAGVPVVWVPTTTVLTSHGFFARLITEVERDGKPVAPAVDCTKGSLAAAIASIVSVPEVISHTPDEGTFSQTRGLGVRDRLTQFLAENWPRPSRYSVYDLLKRLTERRPLRLIIPVQQLRERLLEWEPFFKDAPSAERLERHLREILLPRYIWADQLAIVFANRYRTAYIVCYLLAASAVTAHNSGSLVPEGGETALAREMAGISRAR